MTPVTYLTRDDFVVGDTYLLPLFEGEKVAYKLKSLNPFIVDEQLFFTGVFVLPEEDTPDKIEFDIDVLCLMEGAEHVRS